MKGNIKMKTLEFRHPLLMTMTTIFLFFVIISNSCGQSMKVKVIPLINRLEPVSKIESSRETPTWYTNLDITIKGFHFSSDPSKNKINVIRKVGKKIEIIKSIRPITATREQLTAKWPDRVEPGKYMIQVEVIGFGKSNKRPVFAVSPPLTGRPIIESIEPVRAYPGRTIYINGLNLRNMHLNWVVNPALEESLPHDIKYISYAEKDPELGSREQLKMVVPENIFPGSYIMYTGEINPETGEEDRGHFIEVLAPEYRIDITKIRINPPHMPSIEYDRVFYVHWNFASDELASSVKWERIGVDSIYAAGGLASWADIDFPTGHVFPINGDHKKVSRYLFANAQIFIQWIPRELMSENPEKQMKEELGYIGDALLGISSMFGPEGVAAVKVTTFIWNSLGSLFDFGGDPPKREPSKLIELGQLNFAYDANDLQLKTRDLNSYDNKVVNYFEDKVRLDDYKKGVTIEVHYKISRDQSNP